MPAFMMTNPEIALVQGFLVGLCPVGSATGDELFAANCATCHGPGGVGTATALNVRCATRVADAMLKGRGARMPAFPGVAGSEVSSIQGHLATICNGLGRPGLDLYVGNCATCHGTMANGGTNGLGERGPGIQCTGANDYTEKVSSGGDGMPAFPNVGPGDVTAIVNYVHGAFCPGG
jgi:ubiquinol-cytochrome c reductase cytochrome c subunit